MALLPIRPSTDAICSIMRLLMFIRKIHHIHRCPRRKTRSERCFCRASDWRY